MPFQTFYWRDNDCDRYTACDRRAALEPMTMDHHIKASHRRAESIAPKPRLAAELKRVTDSAEKLIEALNSTNLKEELFPTQRLIDISYTMIALPYGSEEGALPALEYAEAALNDVRFLSVEIPEGDQLPDVPRGGRVDQSLQVLISDISTAKRFYSQRKLDAAGRADTPDHATVDKISDASAAARSGTAAKEGIQLANEIDQSTRKLVAQGDADFIVSDNLTRRTRDVANLLKQESIEFSADRPRVAWLEKLDRGVEVSLRGIEVAAAIGEIAVRKIGQVLINHVKDWFGGVREFAEESRTLIAQLKKKWHEENREFSSPSVRSPEDLSSFLDAFKDGSGQGPELLVIPLGAFLMGSGEEDAKLKKQDRALADEIVPGRGKHRIQIRRRFALGKFPVTNAEYAAFVKTTSPTRKLDQDVAIWNDENQANMPAVNVSWYDALDYCQWLNKMTNLGSISGYRLPSEAEWEYACRAGTHTRRWWGDAWDGLKANGHNSYPGTTSPVNRYPPNPWRLHDMIGNVWEWCADRYAPDLVQVPDDGSANARTPQVHRVLRGGAWGNEPEFLRCAKRFQADPALRRRDFGFRVARTLVP